MDEREAYELFAPARERTLPQPRIAMAEVYEADARRRKQQRWTAIGGSVSAAVLVVSAGLWVTREGDAGQTASATTSPSISTKPDLLGVLRQVAVPADATRSYVSASPRETGRTEYLGDYETTTWTWTTALSPAVAIATVRAHPPASMTSNSSGSGTGPHGEVDASITYDGTATAAHSPVELEVSASSFGSGQTSLSATAWVVIRRPKPATALVTGTIESLTGGVSAVGTSPAQRLEVPLAEAQKIASTINNALMAFLSGPHECGPNPQQTTLVFRTSRGAKTYEVSCGFVYAGAGSAQVSLEVPPGLSDELGKALAAVTPTPSPSFAPTPGIGTLDIGIQVVGGPPPGVNATAAAGTITVSQDGKTIEQKKVTEGQRWSAHLPAGSYQVRASIGGACQPVTVKAESGGVTPVEARCDIR